MRIGPPKVHVMPKSATRGLPGQKGSNQNGGPALDMKEEYEPEPLDIDHDDLIAQIIDRNAEDRERGSSAGESRQKIGEYLEKSGMNGKAFSVCRQILKLKKYSQRMDLIRSLEEALPMVKAHVVGQDFGPDLVDRAQAEEATDFADPAEDPTPSDDEQVDFDAAVDGVADDSGNVVRPFGVGSRK